MLINVKFTLHLSINVPVINDLERNKTVRKVIIKSELPHNMKCLAYGQTERVEKYTNVLNKSMLMKTYSPLSKCSSAALSIILRTVSEDAHSTTTRDTNTQTNTQTDGIKTTHHCVTTEPL